MLGGDRETREPPCSWMLRGADFKTSLFRLERANVCERACVWSIVYISSAPAPTSWLVVTQLHHTQTHTVLSQRAEHFSG